VSFLFNYLLNLVYLLLLIAVSPLILYAAIRKGKYREGFAAKFLGLAPRRTSDAPCVWLHAVSVGEVNLLAGLIAELERRRPELECVISTTTTAGYLLARQKYAPRKVFYCPLDFTWAVRAALRRVRPDLLVLAELELWPNLVSLSARRGVPVAVANGRLSAASHRGYSKARPLVRWMLRRVNLVAAQNEEYAERFRDLGPAGLAVKVTGSLKYDGAETDRHNETTRRLKELAGISSDDIVFLAGSTQEPEEQLAIETFRRLGEAHPRLKLLIVPRHPHRFEEVAALLVRSGLPWRRRSELVTGKHSATRVLLIDTVGELGAWWGTADIAFVGGSMGSRGGQNMIEPAAYGAAVSFGPNTRNFRDVVEAMFAADAARVVHDREELTAFVRDCLEHPEQAAEMGRRGQQLVLRQLGATRATVDLLEPLLPAQGVSEDRRAA